MSVFGSPFASPFGSGYAFIPGPGGSDLTGLGATPASDLSGQLDMLIDPNTGEYLETADGEFAETADSRTTMLLMLELEHAASPFSPGDGTTLAERRRQGDPITPEDVQAETLRAGAVLQAAGLIADLDVRVRDDRGDVLRDQSGRLLVLTSWRDLASGSPVDLITQG